MRLTRTHRAVLGRLAAGWVMDPAGEESTGAVLFDKGSDVVRVSARTVDFLLANGLIQHGDAWFPFKLTVVGRDVGLMVNAKKRVG
jgi:hypothetical protein